MKMLNPSFSVHFFVIQAAGSDGSDSGSDMSEDSGLDVSETAGEAGEGPKPGPDVSETSPEASGSDMPEDSSPDVSEAAGEGGGSDVAAEGPKDSAGGSEEVRLDAWNLLCLSLVCLVLITRYCLLALSCVVVVRFDHATRTLLRSTWKTVANTAKQVLQLLEAWPFLGALIPHESRNFDIRKILSVR